MPSLPGITHNAMTPRDYPAGSWHIHRDHMNWNRHAPTPLLIGDTIRLDIAPQQTWHVAATDLNELHPLETQFTLHCDGETIIRRLWWLQEHAI